jgi:hypothetical protein
MGKAPLEVFLAAFEHEETLSAMSDDVCLAWLHRVAPNNIKESLRHICEIAQERLYVGFCVLLLSLCVFLLYPQMILEPV